MKRDKTITKALALAEARSNEKLRSSIADFRTSWSGVFTNTSGTLISSIGSQNMQSSGSTFTMKIGKSV